MSDDGWRRPEATDVPDDVPIFEIPLDGEYDDPSEGAADVDEPTNWRLVAGLSSLGGIALGIIVSVVLLAGGDDGEQGAPTTTIDPAELGSVLPVPPTLPPLDDEPVPATDGLDPVDVAATVATLPPLFDMPSSAPPIDPATIVPADGVARRAVTEYSIGAGGFDQIVTITNDPATARYHIQIATGEAAATPIVVDLAGDRFYVAPDPSRPDEWVSIPTDELASSTGTPSAAALMRALQLGPLRDDTVHGVRLVRHNGPVDVPDAGGALMELVVVVDAQSIPLWARYALGPSSEAPPPAANDLVGMAVYLDDGGAIRRISGSNAFGSTTERFVHTIEVLDEAPVIELPDPDDIVDAVAGRPATIDQMATAFPEYPDPVDAGEYGVDDALDDLDDRPPVVARVSTTTTSLWSRTRTELDPEAGLVRLTSPPEPTTTIVRIDTGEALTSGSGTAPWRAGTTRFDPLLPTPIVDPETIRSMMSLDSDSTVVYVVGEGNVVWQRLDVAVPVDLVELQPAIATNDRFTDARVRLYVDDASRVAAMELLLDGPDPRAIFQRFERPDPPPTVTWPLDD